MTNESEIPLKRVNIHNHTTFSDGFFSPEDIIRMGIDCNLDVIGISDHLQTSKVSRFVALQEIESYITTLRNLQEKYQDQIKVLIGIEVDASVSRTKLGKIDYSLLSEMDFVLFEYVHDREHNGILINDFLDIRDKINTRVGLAHNDLERNFCKFSPIEVIETLEMNDVFIELSCHYKNTREYKGFKEYYYRIAQHFLEQVLFSHCKVTIGTDTHRELEEVGNIDDALNFIENYGLKRNYLDFT